MPVIARKPSTNGRKIHRVGPRKLELVAEARATKAFVRGWVEALGRYQIRHQKGNVEIFCIERETAKTIYYERRVFLAERLQLVASKNGRPTTEESQPNGSSDV
jgi:hypothetical protein